MTYYTRADLDAKVLEDAEYFARIRAWREEWSHLATGWVHPANRPRGVTG